MEEGRLDFRFWKDALDTPIEGPESIDDRYEIAFDAANCLKFGRDIVMSIGTKNHELGAAWLQRHLGDRYRVHAIRLCDGHIDGHLVPLAPGKLLDGSISREDAYTLANEIHKKYRATRTTLK